MRQVVKALVTLLKTCHSQNESNKRRAADDVYPRNHMTDNQPPESQNRRPTKAAEPTTTSKDVVTICRTQEGQHLLHVHLNNPKGIDFSGTQARGSSSPKAMDEVRFAKLIVTEDVNLLPVHATDQSSWFGEIDSDVDTKPRPSIQVVCYRSSSRRLLLNDTGGVVSPYQRIEPPRSATVVRIGCCRRLLTSGDQFDQTELPTC